MLANQLWERTCERLKKIFTAEVYRLWIARLKVLDYESNILSLGVWDEFAQIWFKENYVSALEATLREITGESITVQLQVVSFEDHSESSAGLEDVSQAENLTGSSAAQNMPAIPPTVYTPGTTTEVQNILNPKYTFESFVVGDNSSMAHAAAMAVAQNPGQSYNPLFIYGGVGLGKTHLLHAIGNRVIANAVKKGKRVRVVYVTLEKFLNEYIEAVREQKCDRFRRKYRRVDVLLIDDVQFLTGREGLQEEFFHTFNDLYNDKKQIVLTSDRSLSEIKKLEERLVSRFSWGLVTDIQPPNVDLRMAILKQKAKDMNFQMPNEVCVFLAQKIRANVRELEGALIRMGSYINLTQASWSIETAKVALQDLLSRQSAQAPNIEDIQKKVATVYDIRVADLISKKRPANIAFPRQVAMYLCRELTHQPLIAIGEAFGGRDHGTVIHACKVVENQMDVDDNVRNSIQKLKNELEF